MTVNIIVDDALSLKQYWKNFVFLRSQCASVRELVMTLTNEELWVRFQKYYTHYPELGLSLDLSRMIFTEDFFEQKQGDVEAAFKAMDELEAGAIANPDENRMVGYYWLRNPAIAPKTNDIAGHIDEMLAGAKACDEET